MWVWIEPLDVLMFRDSRPFSGGETHRARSLFPPNPLTFLGAVRAKLLEQALSEIGRDFNEYNRYCREQDVDGDSEELESLKKRFGFGTDPGKLHLRGPFLARREASIQDLFFPLPFDLLKSKEREGKKGREIDRPVPLQPLEDEFHHHAAWDEQWPAGALPLWNFEEGAKEATGYWLNANGLKNYLEGGSASPEWFTKAGDLYDREQRAGIKLQAGQRTVEQGMLYVAEFIRLRSEHGFLLDVELEGDADGSAVEPLKRGILQLGGEARGCRHHGLDGEPQGIQELRELKIADAIDGSGRFKLYLASPAIFKNGWLPDFIDRDRLKGNLKGSQAQVRLIAAAVGKPLPIGGWDLARNRPKTLCYAVPPGSVYFFELEDGSVEDIWKTFHFTSKLQEMTTDNELARYARIGFGLTFVGYWEYCQPKGG